MRFFADAPKQNFGLTKLEILPGNVGYLLVSGFVGAPGAEEVVASALRFLERTDAIIIDVRTNRGGSGNMSHYLFSHFLPEKPVQTISVKSRDSAQPRVQESIAEVLGPRRTDVPLYVLTSRGTGSAAEEFAFVLKNQGRATLVGERTAGAGHMVGSFALPAGFVAGVSLTRVSDPRTGREFEAVGVQPDVAVDAEHALTVAHVAALKWLAARAPNDAAHRRIDLLAEWIEAKDRAAALDAARAAAAVGTYDGERSVTLRAGRLYYQRGGMPALELTPLASGGYTFDGETRIRFGDGAPAPVMTLDRSDGTSANFARAGVGAPN
jgi:C-terminal processing protease CtpA/Prc